MCLLLICLIAEVPSTDPRLWYHGTAACSVLMSHGVSCVDMCSGVTVVPQHSCLPYGLLSRRARAHMIGRLTAYHRYTQPLSNNSFRGSPWTYHTSRSGRPCIMHALMLFVRLSMPGSFSLLSDCAPRFLGCFIPCPYVVARCERCAPFASRLCIWIFANLF